MLDDLMGFQRQEKYKRVGNPISWANPTGGGTVEDRRIFKGAGGDQVTQANRVAGSRLPRKNQPRNAHIIIYVHFASFHNVLVTFCCGPTCVTALCTPRSTATVGWRQRFRQPQVATHASPSLLRSVVECSLGISSVQAPDSGRIIPANIGPGSSLLVGHSSCSSACSAAGGPCARRRRSRQDLQDQNRGQAGFAIGWVGQDLNFG